MYEGPAPHGEAEDAAAVPVPREPSGGASDVSGEPPIPEDADAGELDPSVRRELAPLARHTADAVARRLVASGRLLEADPRAALAHALVARRLAPRLASVREAVGLAAYHTGEWSLAIAELRAYHRIAGRQNHLAVIADAERALGRPERAIDLYRTADLKALEPADAIELLIVAAGARRDLGQTEAAVAMLQVPELTSNPDAPWTPRLRYAYADALLAAGRRDDARHWFAQAAELDDELTTDAVERLLDLDGVVLDDAAELDDLTDDADEPYDTGPAPADGEPAPHGAPALAGIEPAVPPEDRPT